MEWFSENNLEALCVSGLERGVDGGLDRVRDVQDGGGGDIAGCNGGIQGWQRGIRQTRGGGGGADITGNIHSQPTVIDVVSSARVSLRDWRRWRQRLVTARGLSSDRPP